MKELVVYTEGDLEELIESKISERVEELLSSKSPSDQVDSNEYLNVHETLGLLKVSRSTLRRLVKKDAFGVYGHSMRKQMFKRSELISYIEAGTQL
jgi:hypothetical protein